MIFAHPASIVQCANPNIAIKRRIVLVVEAVADVREFLGNALEMMGHSALLFEDCNQALERIRQMSPDAVLMDWHSCGIRIDYFIAEVHKSNTHAAIIVMTASGIPDNAHDLGLTHFLSKPFSIGALQGLLHTCMSPPNLA